MQGSLRLFSLVAVIGLSAGLFNGVAQADETPLSGKEKIDYTINQGIGFGASLNRSTMDATLTDVVSSGTTTDASGKIVDRQAPGTAQMSVTRPNQDEITANADFQCLVQTKENNNFRAGSPFRSYGNGNSYTLDWIYHYYTVDYARVVDGAWTFQLELCGTGGGHTRNYYNQTFNGAAQVVKYIYSKKVGQTWGTNSSFRDGAIQSTLNFEVSGGPVKIGASTTLAPRDTYGGNTGHEQKMTDYPFDRAYDPNRVNTFYTAPANWRWDGTNTYQGNNMHSLYEYPQTWPNTINFSGYATMRAHCSRGEIDGGCPAFN